jgi:hypothetical protein
MPSIMFVHARERDMRTMILVGKPEWKRPLGRQRRRWKDNLEHILEKWRGEGVDWMHLDRDRDQWRVIVNTVMTVRVP